MQSCSLWPCWTAFESCGALAGSFYHLDQVMITKHWFPLLYTPEPSVCSASTTTHESLFNALFLWKKQHGWQSGVLPSVRDAARPSTSSVPATFLSLDPPLPRLSCYTDSLTIRFSSKRWRGSILMIITNKNTRICFTRVDCVFEFLFWRRWWSSDEHVSCLWGLSNHL